MSRLENFLRFLMPNPAFGGQFGPENKLIEGQPNEYGVICRNASALAFHLWPTIFAGAPFRLQNICRNGVPLRSRTTTPLITAACSSELASYPVSRLQWIRLLDCSVYLILSGASPYRSMSACAVTSASIHNTACRLFNANIYGLSSSGGRTTGALQRRHHYGDNCKMAAGFAYRT